MPPPTVTPRASLPVTHLLLALLVVAVWGTNFVVIRMGLDQCPPLLFAALRFAFAFLPAALVVPRPAVPWRNLLAYGLLLGPGMFGLLFLAMRGHISPGLASLLAQTQVFFTIGLSVWRQGERVSAVQLAALALAVCGIVVIAAHTDTETSVLGVALVLCAAFNWALANLVGRATPGANMLGYVVWASLFSAPPLFALSLIFEGWPAIIGGLAHADATLWAAVLWQAVGNTMLGFGLWAWLLARHPAATITPTALLIPVFGMGASAWWLHEPLPAWKLGAAALVVAGLVVGVVGPRWRRRRYVI